ncbi:MAG: aminopeptidase N, partial [Nocardioidaceae bacterium]
MPSLTLAEARARAELLSVHSYDVSLDLTGDDRTFLSRSVVRFTARESAETFVEVKAEQLDAVRLNGTRLPTDGWREGRLPLRPDAGDNELVVEARMAYSRDGEGMHRAVDPADGHSYVYAMSFLDAAPRVFGCFDQPDLKATFTVRVDVPIGWVVRGNGRARETDAGHWELATTRPMPTYGLTVVAGPLHVVEGEHDGIALGLSARASLARHLDRDAEELFTVTGQCFDELHRLFGTRYVFGDYHQAFVPEFNAGAMENPGCVTLRDQFVFTTAVTEAERSERAMVIAHEMAHQWFGDLVTMQWWDDLWLNESFAEYMGHRVAAEATRFRDGWVSGAYERMAWGVASDQRPSTHPVAGNGARDAAEALDNFDGISYAKGAAVLKQLNARLGDQVFFDGVRRHFEAHRFGNATMRDLFTAWEEAGAGDLGPFVQGWLLTPGLDLLRVERGPEGAGVRRVAPAAFPAEREHVLHVATHTSGGWRVEPLVVRGDGTRVEAAAHAPVVLDPLQETFARLGLDGPTRDALPDLLPAMSDPLMRAAVWSAVRDSTRNGLLDPETALALVEAGLPCEGHDEAVRVVGQFAVTGIADLLLDDFSAGHSRVHAAALHRLETAQPGSSLQLAALRLAVATAGEPSLRCWLDGELPPGTEMDLDLRWRMLVRLAELGATDRDVLDKALADEDTLQAREHHVRAACSLPTEEAKEFAWGHFRGEGAAGPVTLEAAARGLWLRGQEQLTAPYVDRYFEEAPHVDDHFSGYLLTPVTLLFFPRLAVTAGTVERARA